MSGHKQWSEIRHKSKATIPDINQVREALDAFDRANATSTKLGLAPRAVPRPVVIAVARAFVEGDLIPAEVDYEAAAKALDAWLAVVMEATEAGYPAPARGEYDGAARIIVDAALAFQESGADE